MAKTSLRNARENTYELVACADEEVVGSLTLWIFDAPRRRHAGGIGMAVRDDWQGKGVGSALMEAALDLADNWLNLARIELHVYTDNEAGIALYEKFGFEIEGTHRRYAFRGDEYVDAYTMARLRTRELSNIPPGRHGVKRGADQTGQREELQRTPR